MYRATQNPDTPDLPFAQSILPTMYRDTQNPDTPDLPFAQTMSFATLSRSSRPNPQHTRYEYIVNGEATGFPYFKPKMVNAKHFWTEDQAQAYRKMGYDVRKVSETKVDTTGSPTGTPTTTSTTGSGLSRSQVENIIEEYHGDDISLLHSHAVDFGKQLTTSKQERDRIEAKVNANKTEHGVMWTSISEKADKSHFHIGGGNGNGNGCEWYDIPCHFGNFTGQVGTVAIVAAIGVGAYYLLKKRTRR